MNFKKAVMAGIAGTITKTLFSYFFSLFEDESVTEPNYQAPLKVFTRNMLINHVLFGLPVSTVYQSGKIYLLVPNWFFILSSISIMVTVYLLISFSSNCLLNLLI